MNGNISYCGMICGNECPIFQATQTNDRRQQEKIAITQSAMGDIQIKPEEVVCDGCKAFKRYFGRCIDCKIRACAHAKGLETCGHCTEYPCEKLEERLEFDPSNKERLDDIKKNLNKSK